MLYKIKEFLSNIFLKFAYFLLRCFLIKNKTINDRKEIYIDLALFINKLMFDDNLITYNLYKITEDVILKNYSE